MKSNNRTSVEKSSKRRPKVAPQAWPYWLVPLLIAVVTCAAFFPALRNQFVNWDDGATLLENSDYRGLSWRQLGWMFSTFYTGHYQPLSWVTFGFDYLIWGTDPFGYHLTNLILHVANSCLFYFLARKLLALAFGLPSVITEPTIDLAAAFAALFFAVHPLRVESVAWATERRDVLSGWFFLLSLTCYLRAQSNPERPVRRQWMSGALIANFLSLLSKATAIGLPVVLLILDFYPLKKLKGDARQISETIWQKAPFFMLSLVFGVVALFAQQDTGALRPFQQYFLSYRVGQAFYGLCFYLGKTLFPIRLSPLYELPFDFEAWTPVFILCGGIIVAITAILYYFRQRWPAAIACCAYYLVVVGPVLGIAQSGPQLVADRYSYLSCLSWALLGAGIFYRCLRGVREWQGRQIATAASAVVILTILSVLTWRQTEKWRDTRTLWQYVQEVTPESSLGLFNLGRIYEDEGQLHQAEEYYSRAVKVNPTFADAHYDLARLLAGRGQHFEAIEHYRMTLKFKPDAVDAHNNLGLSLVSIGDIPASVAQFQRAVQLNPRYAKGFFNLGRVAMLQGDLETAVQDFVAALRLSPDEAEIHLKLGEVLALQGQQEQAVGHFLRAIKLRPEFADAHVALAKSLANLGKNAEAEEHYREGLRLLKARTRNP